MSNGHAQKHAKPVFMSEAEIGVALNRMESNDSLRTEPSRAHDPLHPERLISFYEKHMTYLRTHPKVNPEHYLSNLRTMIKIRF